MSSQVKPRSKVRESKGPFGTALAREKIALALAHLEKQLFLALAYFVEKRLAKRLLLAF